MRVLSSDGGRCREFVDCACGGRDGEGTFGSRLEQRTTRCRGSVIGDEEEQTQVGRADVVLSELGIKRLVLEVKRPGSLIWHRRAVESALDQARRYAATQKVGAVAVSDGNLLYAADVDEGGGLRDRVLVALDQEAPPEALWWVSVHGIYRPRP